MHFLHGVCLPHGVCNPFRSRPSRSLTVTTLLIVGVRCGPFDDALAPPLGFTKLPGSYFAF
jgi:hypothetical protein